MLSLQLSLFTITVIVILFLEFDSLKEKIHDLIYTCMRLLFSTSVPRFKSQWIMIVKNFVLNWATTLCNSPAKVHTILGNQMIAHSMLW